jgi:hypothetical protein
MRFPAYQENPLLGRMTVKSLPARGFQNLQPQYLRFSTDSRMHIVTWSVRLDETAYPLLRAGEDGITPHFHLQAFGKPSWQKMVPKSTEARSPVCWPQKTIIYREREKDLQTLHVTKALLMPI